MWLCYIIGCFNVSNYLHQFSGYFVTFCLFCCFAGSLLWPSWDRSACCSSFLPVPCQSLSKFFPEISISNFKLKKTSMEMLIYEIANISVLKSTIHFLCQETVVLQNCRPTISFKHPEFWKLLLQISWTSPLSF